MHVSHRGHFLRFISQADSETLHSRGTGAISRFVTCVKAQRNTRSQNVHTNTRNEPSLPVTNLVTMVVVSVMTMAMMQTPALLFTAVVVVVVVVIIVVSVVVVTGTGSHCKASM